jgi:hypothetical protein
MLRERETNLKNNVYVLGQIFARYADGEDPAGLWSIAPLYQKLDLPIIQNAARTYLNTGNYVKVVLMPGKKE